MASRGTHTVILDRKGVPPGADDVLLRAVEDALRLPRGHLARAAAMDQREFRLAEGVDESTAHQLADLALAAGFEPRVHAKLGIRFSARRNPLGPIAALGLVMFLILLAMRWLTPLLGASGLALGALAMVVTSGAALLAWRRSIALPLALPTSTLLKAPDRPQSDGVAEASEAALLALDKLRALIVSDVPEAVRGSLSDTHDELRSQVDSLRREADHLPADAGPAAEAIAQRLKGMAPSDPGRAVLQSALDQERASSDAASARRSEVIAELLAVRRAASEASHTLATAPAAGAGDALERVRKQAEAMRKAAAEVRRR